MPRHLGCDGGNAGCHYRLLLLPGFPLLVSLPEPVVPLLYGTHMRMGSAGAQKLSACCTHAASADSTHVCIAARINDSVSFAWWLLWTLAPIS